MWEGIKVTSQSYNGVYCSRKNVIIIFICVIISAFSLGMVAGSLLDQRLRKPVNTAMINLIDAIDWDPNYIQD